MKKTRNTHKFGMLKKTAIIILSMMLLSQTTMLQYVQAETNTELLQEETNASIKTTSISINASTFPDDNFRNYLLNDLQLTELNADTITKTTKLNISGKSIKDLSGIEHFSNLAVLNCSNNLLESITLENPKIAGLVCGDNPSLTTLNIQALTQLTDLDCGASAIEELDLSGNPALDTLFCNNMKLKELDVSHNKNLRWIVFKDNQVEKLTIGENSKLTSIVGDNNLLTDIDVTGYPGLLALELPGNLLTSVDTSNNPKLASLRVEVNQLVALDLTKNPQISSFYLNFNINDQNAKTVGVDDTGTIEMSLYDANFDGTCVSELSQGTIDGNKIIDAPLSGQITYKYYIGEVQNAKKYLTVTLELNLDTYTIDYVLNGGTNNAANPKTYKESGPTVTLNEPTKNGYTFDGWYDQAIGGTKITTIAQGSTGKKTLYARWKTTDYTIQYDNLFGTTTTNPLSYTIETEGINLSDPTNRSGYTFDGWYDQVTGGNKITTITKGSTGKKTLYARWKQLVFEDNSGKIEFEDGQDDRWQFKIEQRQGDIASKIENIKTVYDIFFTFNNTRVEVKEKNMLITLDLETEDQGFQNYKVVYMDDNGMEKERYNPTLVNDGKALQFEANHLSYYGIVAWDNLVNPGPSDKPDTPNIPDVADKPDTPNIPDVADKPDTPNIPDVADKPNTPNIAETPNNTAEPENPQTGDNNALAGFIALLGISIAGLGIGNFRKKNREQR